MSKVDVQYALSNLVPFNNGNLYAIAGQLNGELGQLPEKWAERYRTDASLFGIAYTVMSYQTPIAWVVTDDTGLTKYVVIPKVTYSVTTSTRHQPPCRRYLPFADRHITEL